MGGNSISYINTNPANNDNVWLVISGTTACYGPYSTSSSMITVPVNANGPAPLLTASGSGCLGDTLTISNAQAGQSQLMWYLGGSVVHSHAYGPYTIAGGNGSGPLYNQVGASFIYVTESGYLYACDPGHSRVMRFPPGSNSFTRGEVVAGGNGTGPAANQFDLPQGIWVDKLGYLYVADKNNQRIQKFPPGSTSATNGVTVAGGNGYGGAANQFRFVWDVTVDTAMNIYAVDYTNNRIQKFPPNSTSATNGVTVAGGNGYGSAANQFAQPWMVRVNNAGEIFVVDVSNNRIQKFPANSTSATNAVTICGGNGIGSAANQINLPVAMAFDTAGYLYVADNNNERIQKYPPASVSGTAGVTVAGGNGQGSAANQLYAPRGIFVNKAGDLYVSDPGNTRIQLWPQSAPDSTYIPTVPGSHTATYLGANGCVSDHSAPEAISTPGPASLSISASAITIAAGRADTFRAVSPNPGAAPNYQWYVNGNAAGTNSATFIIHTLADHDSVWCIMASSSGCVSPATATSAHIVVTVTAPLCTDVRDTMFLTVCRGDSVVMGSHIYTASGISIDTFTMTGGCDSIIVLHLTVFNIYADTLIRYICTGDSLRFGNAYYSHDGLYTQRLTGAFGCDSAVSLLLLTRPLSYDTISRNICSGDSVRFGSVYYTQAGYYSQTFTAWYGCDSISTLHLMVNLQTRDTLQQSICSGDSISYAGHSYSVNGYYPVRFSSMHGCDSVVVVHLTVMLPAHDTIAQVICRGDSFVFGGRSYASAGYYTQVLSGAHGCDSLLTLHLQTTVGTLFDTSPIICHGEAFTINGRTYVNAGLYHDTLRGMAFNGCDSFIRIQLGFVYRTRMSVNDTICRGESLRWRGHTYTASGIYYDSTDHAGQLRHDICAPPEGGHAEYDSDLPQRRYAEQQSPGPVILSVAARWTAGERCQQRTIHSGAGR